MKKLFLVGVAALLSTPAFARDSHVNGYYRNDGSYVQPYHRTTPDNTRNNNYSTYGNENPYTGKSGNRPRDESQPQGEYNLGNGMGNNANQNSGNE